MATGCSNKQASVSIIYWQQVAYILLQALVACAQGMPLPVCRSHPVQLFLSEDAAVEQLNFSLLLQLLVSQHAAAAVASDVVPLQASGGSNLVCTLHNRHSCKCVLLETDGGCNFVRLIICNTDIMHGASRCSEISSNPITKVVCE